MPSIHLKRPCRFPGCPNLTDHPRGYCERHLTQGNRWYDANRGTATQRGYNYRWTVESKRYLSLHPLCVECQRIGETVPATVVDHIKPHKGDAALFWDVTNWEPLCTLHHNQKTAREKQNALLDK